MMHAHPSRISLASVFFTFFVDSLCWSIVFPIFAPYFLDVNNQLLSPEVSTESRTTLLGLFLMAFSLGQFFGAPILGEYSDRHGRKRALLIAIFATFICLGISAWSMSAYQLIFLFIGRFLTGVFSGSGSVCLASVSDLSESEKAKKKNFGIFSVLAGLAFVVGAFVGGKLSDATISPLFFPSLPLWIAAGITILNFLFVLFAFKETVHIDHRHPFSFFSAIKNIKSALQTKPLHLIYVVYFLFIFSWNIILQFLPVILIRDFLFTESNIGDLALFVGVCWAIGSGQLQEWLSSRFSSHLVIKCAFLLLAIASMYMILPERIYNILALLGVSVILGGIVWPLTTTIISNLAPEKMQGKILSISQSVQSLALSVSPVVAGLACNLSIKLPFFIGASSFFLAWIFFTMNTWIYKGKATS